MGLENILALASAPKVQAWGEAGRTCPATGLRHHARTNDFYRPQSLPVRSSNAEWGKGKSTLRAVEKLESRAIASYKVVCQPSEPRGMASFFNS
jgi:hypothetical protein